MKAFSLLLLALNLSILFAAHFPTQAWSHEVCRDAWDVCDYPSVLIIGLVAWVGLFFVAKEME